MSKQTIRKYLENENTESADAIFVLAEELLKENDLVKVKNKASVEAFTLVIAHQVIGGWKSGGIAVGVISNFPQKIPFIGEVMKTLGLIEIADDFGKIISFFPKNTVFEDTQEFCDFINILEGRPKHVKNKALLQKYSADEIKQLNNDYVSAIEKLEDKVETLWCYDAGNYDGWDILIKYLNENLDVPVFIS